MLVACLTFLFLMLYRFLYSSFSHRSWKECSSLHLHLINEIFRKIMPLPTRSRLIINYRHGIRPCFRSPLTVTSFLHFYPSTVISFLHITVFLLPCFHRVIAFLPYVLDFCLSVDSLHLKCEEGEEEEKKFRSRGVSLYLA